MDKHLPFDAAVISLLAFAALTRNVPFASATPTCAADHASLASTCQPACRLDLPVTSPLLCLLCLTRTAQTTRRDCYAIIRDIPFQVDNISPSSVFLARAGGSAATSLTPIHICLPAIARYHRRILRLINALNTLPLYVVASTRRAL